MGSKNLAIVNAIKCFSLYNDSKFSYFSSIRIIHIRHIFVTIHPHLRARNISDPNPLGFDRAGASQFRGS